jgi:excisionase family DNA binding protein
VYIGMYRSHGAVNYDEADLRGLIFLLGGSMEEVDIEMLAKAITQSLSCGQKRTYSFTEASLYLHVSPSVLTELVTTGELPAAKIGKSWVIRMQDMDDYLAYQVNIQTVERREALKSGQPGKVVTAFGRVRKHKHPKLPPLPK